MRCGQQAAGVPVTDWFERAAVGASLLCLIYCAGLPLLLAALPALSRIIALPDYFHVWLLGFTVPTSGAALLFGIHWHRAWLPLAVGGVGVALLSAGALLLLGGSFETPVTLAGSLFLVFAHAANWRLRHCRYRHA